MNIYIFSCRRDNEESDFKAKYNEDFYDIIVPAENPEEACKKAQERIEKALNNKEDWGTMGVGSVFVDNITEIDPTKLSGDAVVTNFASHGVSILKGQMCPGSISCGMPDDVSDSSGIEVLGWGVNPDEREEDDGVEPFVYRPHPNAKKGVDPLEDGGSRKRGLQN